MNILESSANNTEKQNSETFVKSMIYSKNSIGPNIEPCGTPQLIFHVMTCDYHMLHTAFY